jgi:hypothetical protein
MVTGSGGSHKNNEPTGKTLTIKGFRVHSVRNFLCDSSLKRRFFGHLCNKLGNVFFFFVLGMEFLIEAIAEYGKNEFPTYCTHDFYYWRLENKLIWIFLIFY